MNKIAEKKLFLLFSNFIFRI